MNEDNSLVPRIATAYQPLAGWVVDQNPATHRYQYRFTGQANVDLGKDFTYAPQGTTGLARVNGIAPRLAYDPSEWQAELGFWPELLDPTSNAESNANFLVMNCWDKAAITVGFSQLGAHTPDHMLPFFRKLVTELPEESAKWFPELKVIGDKLCYVENNRFKSLENARKPDDGIPADPWYRGDFMQFFNPDRKTTDPEELHASARWIEWSRQSRTMRKIQVVSSIKSLKGASKGLHNALKAQAPHHYPNGIDGMRCDYLSAGLAVVHLAPASVGKAVFALTQPDILKAFKEIEYGPGDREKQVVDGVLQRHAQLKRLTYDFNAGEPVQTADA
jgi:hypothetical protein